MVVVVWLLLLLLTIVMTLLPLLFVSVLPPAMTVRNGGDGGVLVIIIGHGVLRIFSCSPSLYMKIDKVKCCSVPRGIHETSAFVKTSRHGHTSPCFPAPQTPPCVVFLRMNPFRRRSALLR